MTSPRDDVVRRAAQAPGPWYFAGWRSGEAPTYAAGAVVLVTALDKRGPSGRRLWGVVYQVRHLASSGAVTLVQTGAVHSEGWVRRRVATARGDDGAPRPVPPAKCTGLAALLPLIGGE